jgi:hypothetical protein
MPSPDDREISRRLQEKGAQIVATIYFMPSLGARPSKELADRLTFVDSARIALQHEIEMIEVSEQPAALHADGVPIDGVDGSAGSNLVE